LWDLQKPGNCPLSERDSLKFRCNACGATTEPNPVHKLTKYIINHPPTSAETPDDDEPGKKKGSKKPKQNDEEKEWAVSTTAEAMDQRKKELLGGGGGKSVLDGEEPDQEDGEEATPTSGEVGGEVVELVLRPGDDPLALLSRFWKSNPPKDSILEKLRKLQSDQDWSDTQLFQVVFGSLFDAKLQTDFLNKADIIKLFVKKPKDQKLLLLCIEKLCIMHSSLIPHLSSILQSFYNNSTVDNEEVIFEWYEEPPKKIPPKTAQQIRDACKPFISWLEMAEAAGGKEEDEE